MTNEWNNRSIKDVFTDIYKKSEWGSSEENSQPFYSGLGSHDIAVVNPYVKVVIEFLSKFETHPNVVDLGCGDFSIGSKIRNHCNNYVACDIVSELIEFNSKNYANLGVDFRTLDMSSDELPEGDIVFIRQVFQHLSNEQIENALQKIIKKYKFLVLTEHLPFSDEFIHNIDKPAGPGVRTKLSSGVVLTSAPFNMKFTRQSTLCSVRAYGGKITTLLYEF